MSGRDRHPPRVTGVRTDHLKRRTPRAGRDDADGLDGARLTASGARRPSPVRATAQRATPAPSAGPRRTTRPARARGRDEMGWTVRLGVAVAALAVVMFVGYRSTEFVGHQAVVGQTDRAAIVSAMRELLGTGRTLTRQYGQLSAQNPQDASRLVTEFSATAARYAKWQGPEDLRPAAGALSAYATNLGDLAKAVDDLYRQGLPIEPAANLVTNADNAGAEATRLLNVYVDRYSLQQVAKEYQ